MPDLFTYVLIGIAIYICVYALLDRVCRCKEQCEAFKAYAVIFSSTSNKKPADVASDMGEAINALKNVVEGK